MQISRDTRQYTLRADAELAHNMRNAIEFSRRLRKRFTSVFRRSSSGSVDSRTRIEGAMRDVANAKNEVTVTTVVKENPIFCTFSDLNNIQQHSPKKLEDVLFDYKVPYGAKKRPCKHPKSPSLETLENFPAAIRDNRLSTPTKNCYGVVESPPIIYVEESSETSNSMLNDSHFSEETISIGLNSSLVSQSAKKDVTYTCKPDSAKFEGETKEVRRNIPNHGRDITQIYAEAHHPVFTEIFDDDAESLGEATPKKLRILTRIPSTDSNSANSTPVKISPETQIPVSPPRYITTIHEEPPQTPLSPIRPTMLPETPLATKARNIFSSSSSSRESSDYEDEELKIETTVAATDKQSVVFRDTQRLSPKALTRNLSPINAVNSDEDFPTILAKQEETQKKISAEMEKKNKSIFESDSDDDLFKPVITSKATAIIQKSETLEDNLEPAEYHLFPPADPTVISSSASLIETKPPVSILDKKTEQPAKANAIWPTDGSSDSDEALFKSNKRAETSKPAETKKMEQAVEPSTKTVKSLFSDDSDDDLFRSTSAKKETVASLGEMSTRTPGKLNVAAFGGKLNNVLMNGPPGPKKSPLSSGEESDASVKVESKLKGRVPGKLDAAGISGKLAGLLVNGPPSAQKPKLEKVAQDDEKNAAAPLDTSLTGTLKSRPRGPANRRPPTRSMIIAPSAIPETDPQAQPVKKSQSDEEIVGPLHF